MFGERLTRQRRAVPGGQPDVQLEQRLPVPLVEFVDQLTAGQIGQRLEDRIEIHRGMMQLFALSCNLYVA